MATIIHEEEAKPKELHPAGMVQAVCIAVQDVGVQHSSFQGKEKAQRKIIIIWETAEKTASGNPFILAKKYTASMYDKANLRSDLEGWAGKKFSPEQLKAFDVDVFIGKNCLLNIVHSDDGNYANIATISPLMAGMPKITASGSGIPDGLKKWIDKLRSEAVPTNDGTPPPPHTEDDLPF